MDLFKVNSAARSSFLPTKMLKDLSIDQAYPIYMFREVQTQFEKRIVAELNNEFARSLQYSDLREWQNYFKRMKNYTMKRKQLLKMVT